MSTRATIGADRLAAAGSYEKARHPPAAACPAMEGTMAMWRKILAAILDFLTIFFVGGFVIGYLTGGTTPEGGFALSGAPALILFALIAVYFLVFTKFLGGTLWQRVLRTRTPAPAQPPPVPAQPAAQWPAAAIPTVQTAAEALPPDIPPELDRWNWGAFLLNWIWGIGNGTFIALLMFVPVANVVMPFVLGAKGSQWAWRNKRWQSVEHFRRVQRLWAIWGVIAWVGWIAVVAAIFISVMQGLKHTEAYEMALARLRANGEAMQALGAPISAGYPWGTIQMSGPNGKADFSVSVTGQKTSGTLYLDATKDFGKWRINRIELEIDGRAERINLGDVARTSGLDDALAALRRGDAATALRLLRALADQGNAAARFNLGSMYRNGEGVPRDDGQAVRLYRLAAVQGNANAQNNLGVMYRDGLALPQDDVLAYMWFNLSAAKGNQNAAKNRDAAAARLTREQLALAQEQARKCQASSYKQCD